MNMLRDKLSWWEDQSLFNHLDYIIIGGGIVGLSTAIELANKDKALNILIIDKQTYPIGASTRNAGFACFGSVSEILEDIQLCGENTSRDLIKMRYDGLHILRNRVTDPVMNYINNGGSEIFNSNDEFSYYADKIDYLNDFVSEAIGKSDCFAIRNGKLGKEIFNQYEGSIYPHLMMSQLESKARKLGVKILGGIEVIEIEPNNHLIHTNQGSIAYPKLIICTNGFSKLLLTQSDFSEDISPARNQVLITEKIPGFQLDACYHMDKGYVYFREVEGRLLIGGGRNINLKAETTANLNQTDQIINHLLSIIHNQIIPNTKINISKTWSGILGVGNTKHPIIKTLDNDIYLAIRMGGMGVAIGSQVGKLTADMIMND